MWAMFAHEVHDDMSSPKKATEISNRSRTKGRERWRRRWCEESSCCHGWRLGRPSSYIHRPSSPTASLSPKSNPPRSKTTILLPPNSPWYSYISPLLSCLLSSIYFFQVGIWLYFGPSLGLVLALVSVDLVCNGLC